MTQLIFSPAKILKNGVAIKGIQSAMLGLNSLRIDGQEIPFAELIVVEKGRLFQCRTGTDTYEIHL